MLKAFGVSIREWNNRESDVLKGLLVSMRNGARLRETNLSLHHSDLDLGLFSDLVKILEV